MSKLTNKKSIIARNGRTKVRAVVGNMLDSLKRVNWMKRYLSPSRKFKLRRFKVPQQLGESNDELCNIVTKEENHHRHTYNLNAKLVKVNFENSEDGITSDRSDSLTRNSSTRDFDSSYLYNSTLGSTLSLPKLSLKSCLKNSNIIKKPKVVRITISSDDGEEQIFQKSEEENDSDCDSILYYAI
mmetsp:Transcript_14545/g.12803  ORF Transcript_14545/g.12803 Transcript_14545/m.12803 type:complete len:185 (-) Transcript_14545:34-588(-)